MQPILTPFLVFIIYMEDSECSPISFKIKFKNFPPYTYKLILTYKFDISVFIFWLALMLVLAVADRRKCANENSCPCSLVMTHLQSPTFMSDRQTIS